jgi:hypothetical protein
MAARTKDSSVRLYRCHRGWIVGVFRQRSMARLAAHFRVLAFALHIENVGVTRFAGLMSGKLHRAGCNLADRSTAIVSILPEARRDHVMSNDEKNDEGENEESREAE